MANVGEWVLYEHKVAQVKKVEDHRVTCVSTGLIESSGNDLAVFSLTLQGKNCADWYQHQYDYLYSLYGSGKLNWVDISRRITIMWIKTMAALGTKEADGLFKGATEYVREIADALEKVNSMVASDGTKLFSER